MERSKPKRNGKPVCKNNVGKYAVVGGFEKQ